MTENFKKLKNLTKNQLKIILLATFFIITLWKAFSGVRCVGFKINNTPAVKGISTTATVVAEHDVLIKSEVNGKIIKINFEEGSSVKKGQLLAVVDYFKKAQDLRRLEKEAESERYEYENVRTRPVPPELRIAEINVEEFQEDLKIQQSVQKKAKSQLTDAYSNAKRLEKLYEEKVISFREFESAKTLYESRLSDYEVSQERIKRLKLQIEEFENRLILTKEGIKTEKVLAAKERAKASFEKFEQGKHELDDYFIRAPFDGYVAKKLLNTGSLAWIESPILRLFSKDDLYIEALVEENNLDNVKAGQNVLVVFDAYMDKVFESKIYEVISSVDPDTGIFVAKVKIPKACKKIIPGMTCDVTILVLENGKENVVPKEFIFSEDGKDYVFKKHRGHAKKIEVEAVSFDNDKAIILNSIKRGDIILKPIKGKILKEGDKVKLKKKIKI